MKLWSPLTPPIGVPRLYEDRIGLLYPGEQAKALVTFEAMRCARAEGRTKIQVRHWTVEPMPGWAGWYLRWKFRLIGRWWPRRPRLILSRERRE